MAGQVFGGLALLATTNPNTKTTNFKFNILNYLLWISSLITLTSIFTAYIKVSITSLFIFYFVLIGLYFLAHFSGEWYINYQINRLSKNTSVKLQFVPHENETIIIKFYNPIISEYCYLPYTSCELGGNSLNIDTLTNSSNFDYINNVSNKSIGTGYYIIKSEEIMSVKSRFSNFGDVLNTFDIPLPKSILEKEKLLLKRKKMEDNHKKK